MPLILGLTKSVITQNYNTVVDLGLTSGGISNHAALDLYNNLPGDPIVQGVPAGDFAYFNANRITVYKGSMSSVAPDAKRVLAHTDNIAGRTAMTYVNQGDTLADGLTPSPNKRLWVIAGSDNEPVYTSELTALGQQIVLNTIAYATAGAAVPKIEGTLTPWETGIPSANDTNIRVIVRADITTNADILLDATFSTDGSGQFSVEDAALPSVTPVDCIFIKNSKKKFHTITTS
jgi:hypothetical protein